MSIKVPDLEPNPRPTDVVKADLRRTRKHFLAEAKAIREHDLSAIKTNKEKFEWLQGKIASVLEEQANNTIPLLDSSLDQIAEVDEVVEEFISQGESYIQSELAAQIFEVIGLSASMHQELTKLLPLVDDLQRKRLSEMLDEWERSAELTVMNVNDATSEEDEDGEDDEDGDEDGDDKDKEDEVAPTEGNDA